MSDELLRVVREAAAAGAAVLRTGLSGRSIRTKGEAGDIVTELDLLAERAVRGVLESLRPGDSVVGEELADHEGEAAGFRWSVDPLDGTTNLVRGLPHYGTSVAVQDLTNNDWVAAAIVAPELNTEYFASRGAGAWRIRAGGAPERLTGAPANRATRLLGTGFSYDSDQRSRQYAALPRLMEQFMDMRSVGSAALGLALAAEGSVDGFLESDLYEFDWAAGALIAEEAGLTVLRPSTHRGGILAYPSDFVLPAEDDWNSAHRSNG